MYEQGSIIDIPAQAFFVASMFVFDNPSPVDKSFTYASLDSAFAPASFAFFSAIFKLFLERLEEPLM